MHFAFWITKATDIDSEYVTLVAFPRREWIHDGSQYYVIRAVPILFLSFTDTPLFLHTSPLLAISLIVISLNR